VDNIIETEINIAGSGSAFECWYGTVERQTQPTYHTMETCVTTTWMKLCDKLLEQTGHPKYADQVEKSFYNALMASMKYDGSEIAKYSPLEGSRIEGEEQCSMHINCCNANGPRGFVMMPSFAIKTTGRDVFINYYGASEAHLLLENKHNLTLRQTTSYPETGLLEISINPERELDFSVNLRIPAWSDATNVKVNDSLIENIVPGDYLRISRTWTKNDKISIEFDMRGRLHENHGYQAITMGPMVLTRDSRFEDGFVDETVVIQNEMSVVNLTPIASKPPHIWMAFSVDGLTGTDLEGTGKIAKPIRFCDFASAGNTWDSSIRYRVWIRKTLNVMNRRYEGY
jgi:DUF1680 family protein